MRLRIPIVSLLVLVLTASAQDFQIRTRVDLVVVPVTVKASDDKLINGLQKEDFIVFEDGQRQTITNFTSRSSSPVRRRRCRHWSRCRFPCQSSRNVPGSCWSLQRVR